MDFLAEDQRAALTATDGKFRVSLYKALFFKETNQNLIDGKNPYLTIRADGSFHVSTPKQERVECLSLGTFFPERKYISMLEMLATVDHATNFLDEFEHWQIKYQRARPAKKILFAGIIGYGCDIGHLKLAQISKQIPDW